MTVLKNRNRNLLSSNIVTVKQIACGLKMRHTYKIMYIFLKYKMKEEIERKNGTNLFKIKKNGKVEERGFEINENESVLESVIH